MTAVVAVIAEEGLEDAAISAGRALDAGADLVEFRLDHLPRSHLPEARVLSKQFGRRAIATLRSRAEGGRGEMTVGERMAALRELAQAGFAFLDAELDGDAPVLPKLREICRAAGTDLIASAHPPAPLGPEEIRRKVRSACRAGDVGKVAVEAPTVGAALELSRVAAALKAEGLRHCLIATGPSGAITRVRAQALGAEFNYVYPGGVRAAAPGQLDLGRALGLRRAAPTVLGLMGYPVGHSVSPAMHNAALDHLGIPGIYLPLATAPGEVKAVMGGLAEMGFRGVNVTVPYKQAVIPYLDGLDGDAAAVGAVNTIAVGPEGTTVGFNTDLHGFRALLASHGVGAQGRSTLILGAGGAARAVAFVLSALGARVAVYNRSRERTVALAEALPGVELPEGQEVANRRWDVVVNCTPGDPFSLLGLPTSILAPGATAIDLVYNPPSTPFLQAAGREGARAIGGLEMLVHQGAKAFELWLGRPAPVDVMRVAAREALG